jgi:hypothetical protein
LGINRVNCPTVGLEADELSYLRGEKGLKLREKDKIQGRKGLKGVFGTALAFQKTVKII